ncbi:MAG: alpha-2-macroglobulin family protein [Archangium sp.]|nr:alpha-2-macroglobulin family protein [Archangium sp.]
MPAIRLLSVGAVCLLLTAGANKVTDPITTARVGGATRFLTHVSTDKPIYKIGETVYARGVVLDAKTRVPAPNGQYAQITIKGPKGETITAGQAQVTDGTFGFSWVVPEGQAGGEFTLSAAGAYGHAPGERKFDVRVYRAPRLKNQITFARDGYGQGDTLSATLETTRAEGGVPKGAKITAVARVDGVDVAKAPCALDDQGRCTVSLKLPATIERGEGTLAFTIEDGGVVETATKTIPLLVTSFAVNLFPEGGDLVAGLTNRVYLEARTLSQKPADIAGIIVDSKGKQVATFRTEHEGRGRFSLNPVKGESYTLQVTEPASVKKTVALPAPVNEGATLFSASELTAAEQPVKLTVAWTGDRVVKVSLRQRDLELSNVEVDARKQKGTEVSLDAKDAEGVLVATVTTKDGTPLAERLVFRAAKKNLSIELKADRERYVPGAPVSLELKTTIDGKPAAAFVGLTVTDDSIQELIEKREQAPTLPVMVFLEDDVRELADAHVYLDTKNPKSKLAVDLLLGTQGWRRFAMINVADFLNREQDEARRVLAMFDGQSMVPTDELSMIDLAPRGGAVKHAPGRPMLAPPQPAPPMVQKPQEARAPVAAVMARPPAPPPAAEPVMKREAAKMDMRMNMGARAIRAEEDRVVMGDSMRVPFTFVTIREFAHQVRPDRKPNDRLDFAETLYWSAAIRTDASGKATVKFGMSDAVTSFRAAADGFTATGVLGAAHVKLDSVKAFYVEPKLPLEVTEGDVIRLPIAFVNGTREPLSAVSMAITSKADLRFTAPQVFALKSDERARRVVELTIGPKTRSTELTLNATAGGYSDVVTRELSIKPKGFPAQQASGGLLQANGKASFKFTIPADTVAGSVTTSIALYPSPAGNLSSALKSMIQEPSGCFEQTSSTVYPMTMAMQYFNTHTGSDPALMKDAQDKLERGYKRLVGYECKQKGYEWFGEDPGHEALTAYGILEFTDMAKVRSVDPVMLSNSKAWLLKQRDGKGGFERKRRALHTWIEDKDTSDAYITWALLESGEKNLTAEVKRVKEAGLSSANSYVVAVAANVAQLSGDAATAGQLLKKLAAKQDEKGFVAGGTQSIVGSTGQSLAIETTAFATLAWLRAGNEYVGNVEKAIKGLAEASKDGSYGATQSTVLALKAVLEYDRVRSAGRKPGAVKLLVDGKPLGVAVKYDGTTQTALMLPDASELLSAGEHTLELVQEGGGQLPWSMAVKSNRVKPENSPETKVSLEVALSKASLSEGDVVEATARVTNLTDAQLPTVVAIVGVPGGLEPRIDQLKELVKAKTIDAYEVMGRDVVLYWRGMTPKSSLRVPISLVAAVPGKYLGPASRAYLYYGNEHKAWVEGLKADVVAKN